MADGDRISFALFCQTIFFRIKCDCPIPEPGLFIFGMVLSSVLIKLFHMSINLIKILAQRQDQPDLPPVDPNTQDISAASATYTDKLVQAAIPVVLTGMYKYSRDIHQADQLIDENFGRQWQDKLFGENRELITAEVASYADVSREEADAKLKEIFSQAVEVIKSSTGNPDANTIAGLFTAQRNNILTHLPAAIGIGGFLEDDSLDDRTNKMHGPASSFMHTVEKVFSSSENPEDLPGK